MSASLYPGVNSLDLVIAEPVDQYTSLVRDDLQYTKVWSSTTSGFTPDAGTLVYQGPDLAITIPNLTAGTTYYVKYALISELDISESLGGAGTGDDTYIISNQLSAIPIAAGTGTTLYYIATTSPVIYKNAANKNTVGDFTNITVYGKTSSAGVESAYGYLTITGDTETEAVTATASSITTSISSSSTNTIYTVKLYAAANKVGGAIDTETIAVVFKGDNAISVELTNGSHPLPAEGDGTGVVLLNSGTDIYVYEGGELIPYNASGYDSGNFNTWKITKADSAGITSGTITDQGSFARLSALTAVGSTVTTAAVTFTINGRTSSGVTFTTTKVQSFTVNREGVSYTTVIESTNGDEFRVGEARQTILIAHVFFNGVEITDTLPSSRFKWRRVSVVLQAYPNDDATWNAVYVTGFKQVTVNVDDIYAKATFFCDILGE